MLPDVAARVALRSHAGTRFGGDRPDPCAAVISNLRDHCPGAAPEAFSGGA
jgi:hypothetical protein